MDFYRGPPLINFVVYRCHHYPHASAHQSATYRQQRKNTANPGMKPITTIIVALLEYFLKSSYGLETFVRLFANGVTTGGTVDMLRINFCPERLGLSG